MAGKMKKGGKALLRKSKKSKKSRNVKQEDVDMNMYYLNNSGQAMYTFADDEIAEVEEKKKKEREKRIRENKKKAPDDDFDLDTEMVIQMTNKNKIKKEEEQRKIQNKKEIKKKKRNKKIKFFIKLILFIGVTAGGITFALVSPIFNIQEIRVTNNANVPSDTVVSLSGLTTEVNIFKFWSIKAINKIKENPYIQDVKIHRKLPNAIEIEVQEREPKYCIKILESYAYVSNQGYILEISEDGKGLPIMKGIKTPEEELTAGNRLNSEDLNKLEDVIKIMNSAEKQKIGEKVTTIDISNKNDYIIYIDEQKKTIHLGDDSNLSDKMLNAVTIMEKEKEKAGEIFVNGDLNNKFQPYFREQV